MRGKSVSRRTIPHPEFVKLMHDLPLLSTFEDKSAELAAFISNIWFGCFGFNGPLRQYFSLY